MTTITADINMTSKQVSKSMNVLLRYFNEHKDELSTDEIFHLGMITGTMSIIHREIEKVEQQN